MMRSRSREAGFTAVELLITLIVAAMFLFGGYQIYAQVSRDGGEASRMAIVSGKVSDKLRKEAVTTTTAAPSGCTASNEMTNAAAGTETVTGVGTITYTKTVKCSANPSTIDLFMIKIEGSYNDSGTTKKVQHAIFVN